MCWPSLRMRSSNRESISPKLHVQQRAGWLLVFCWIASSPVFADFPVSVAGATASPYRLQQGRNLESEYRLVAPYRVQTNLPSESPPLAHLPYAGEVAVAARSTNLDPALVHALIFVESGHRQQAVSPKGAVGLMQLMPATASRYGVKAPATSHQDNLRAGTRYLRDLLDLFENRLDLALAAYNAGEGAVKRYGNRIPPFAETRSYVPSVMEKYKELRLPEPVGPQSVVYLPGTRLDRQKISGSNMASE